jgi:hypothetical protein
MKGVPMTAVHSTTLRALFASLVRIIELDPAGADQKGVKAAVECISHVLEDDAAAAHLVQMPETTFGTVLSFFTARRLLSSDRMHSSALAHG